MAIEKQKNAHRRAAVEGIVAVAAVATTVASQFSEGLTPIFFACWLSLLLLTVAAGRDRLVFCEYSLVFILAALLGLPIFFAAAAVTGETGYLTGFYMLLVKTLFMYLIGYCLCASERTSAIWGVILAVYLVSAAAYAAWMMITYFPGLGSWLDSPTYLFAQKNSAGQIVGVSSILAILIASGRSRSVRLMLYAYAAATFAVVVFMQCRSAMLGCAAAFSFLFVSRGHKRVFIVAVVCATLIYFLSGEVHDLVDHALLLDKYQSMSIDSMSSGRVGLWSDALMLFSANPFFGVGDYYVDNMYINCLVNVGIFGGLPFFALWIWRIARNNGLSRISTSEDALGIEQHIPGWLPALTIFYLVESVLEGFPPFGPGSCAFMFWMMCGFSDSLRAIAVESKFGKKTAGVIFR